MAVIAALSMCLGGCAAYAVASFTPSGTPKAKTLYLVGWIGSIDDFRRSKDITQALYLRPDYKPYFWNVGGRDVLNFTDVLSFAPMADIPGTTISYRILEPNGLAARGMRPIASIVARGSMDIHLDWRKLCIRKADIAARFGPPIEAHQVIDALGSAYSWRISTHGRWHTYANATFSPTDNTCTTGIGVTQTTA